MATTSAPEPGGGRAPGAAAALSEQLYARHHRMVAGLCRALLRDPAEAEDAAQQAFLSAHRALLNGAEPREPAAWLATIARNECRGRIGARMREPLATDQADTVAGAADPVAEALRRADLAALWQAIEALPRTQRDALLLREFGGLRYDELAVALAVTEPAVESLLVRARTSLRAQLKAAYASLGGGAWLDWLGRLATGGAAPAAATKAIALGLGAAAVTSGAVVGPRLVDRHDRRPSTPTTTARQQHRQQPPTIAAVLTPAAPAVTHRLARAAATTGTRHERDDGHAGVRDGGQDGRDEAAPATTVEGLSHEQEHVSTTTQAADGGHEGEDGGAATTATTTATTTTTVSDSGEGDGGGGGEGGTSGSDG